MSALGDRRTRVRLEVVGALWGTLELDEPARVVNISTTGALIESPIPASLQSSQPVRLTVGEEVVTVDTRVRHVRQVTAGGEAQRYLIGLEFVSPSTLFVHSIEQRKSRGTEIL